MKIYDFGQYASTLYDFVWTGILRLVYRSIRNSISAIRRRARERRQLVRSLLFHIFETILKLLHPISPYITEELHTALYNQMQLSNYAPLIVETWPGLMLSGFMRNEKAEHGFRKFTDVVRAVRNCANRSASPIRKSFRASHPYFRRYDREPYSGNGNRSRPARARVKTDPHHRQAAEASVSPTFSRERSSFSFRSAIRST